jgi:hypothetical protein
MVFTPLLASATVGTLEARSVAVHVKAIQPAIHDPQNQYIQVGWVGGAGGWVGWVVRVGGCGGWVGVVGCAGGWRTQEGTKEEEESSRAPGAQGGGDQGGGRSSRGPGNQGKRGWSARGPSGGCSCWKGRQDGVKRREFQGSMRTSAARQEEGGGVRQEGTGGNHYNQHLAGFPCPWASKQPLLWLLRHMDMCGSTQGCA